MKRTAEPCMGFGCVLYVVITGASGLYRLSQFFFYKRGGALTLDIMGTEQHGRGYGASRLTQFPWNAHDHVRVLA